MAWTSFAVIIMLNTSEEIKTVELFLMSVGFQ